MTVTFKDIAQQAGVSPMTVSRALRGGGSIRPQTLRKVRQVARGLGYPMSNGVVKTGVSRNAAQPLKLLAPSFATFASTSSGWWYLDCMLEGLSDRLTSIHGQMLVARYDSVEALAESYRQQRCDGIILREPLPKTWIEQITKIGPTIYAVAYDCQFGVDAVYSNEYRSACMCHDQLTDRGHHHIAWLGILDRHQPYRMVEQDATPYLADRQAGEVHGVRYGAWSSLVQQQPTHLQQPVILVNRDWRSQSLENVVHDALDQLLEQQPDTTAIICSADPVAVEVIRHLRQRGMNVPEQMSIVTYGGSAEAKTHHPPISCVQMPMAMIGRVIPELIERRLADPTAPPLSVQLETTWFEGGTIAPPC